MIDHQKRWELYLLRSDWSLVAPPKLLDDSGVTPDVLLATNEEDGETTAEVLDFGDPLKASQVTRRKIGTAETNLLLNVVQRIWRVNGKTNEDYVGVRVAEWAKAVVVFLASGIPQC